MGIPFLGVNKTKNLQFMGGNRTRLLTACFQPNAINGGEPNGHTIHRKFPDATEILRLQQVSSPIFHMFANMLTKEQRHCHYRPTLRGLSRTRSTVTI